MLLSAFRQRSLAFAAGGPLRRSLALAAGRLGAQRSLAFAAGGLGATVATAACSTAAAAEPRSDTERLFRLDGRLALVTGSTRGIGHAMALGLADQGATVVLHGSSPRNLEAARAALLQASPSAQCSTIDFDVGNEDACRDAIATVVHRHGRLEHKPAALNVQAAVLRTQASILRVQVQRHGRLDILVNNAGINRRHSLAGPKLSALHDRSSHWHARLPCGPHMAPA